MSRFLSTLTRQFFGVALALGAMATVANAQGVVRGRISIREHAGDKTQDLGNTVVYLEPAAGAQPPVDGKSTKVQIAMQDRQFAPRIRIIPANATVEFPNQDPFSHNIFSSVKPGEFDLGTYGRGTTKSATFARPGVYPVYCNIHARMTAYVVVVATPYYGQAGADGTFSMANVPAGSYTLHVWHERAAGEARVPLTVARTGADNVTVELNASGYRAPTHKNKFGQEYSSSGSVY